MLYRFLFDDAQISWYRSRLYNRKKSSHSTEMLEFIIFTPSIYFLSYNRQFNHHPMKIVLFEVIIIKYLTSLSYIIGHKSLNFSDYHCCMGLYQTKADFISLIEPLNDTISSYYRIT